MLRQNFTETLKSAMKARDESAVSTCRLIMAALKDRDIAARGRGKMDGIDEAEILSMMQTMIKQRKESISVRYGLRNFRPILHGAIPMGRRCISRHAAGCTACDSVSLAPSL